MYATELAQKLVWLEGKLPLRLRSLNYFQGTQAQARRVCLSLSWCRSIIGSPPAPGPRQRITGALASLPHRLRVDYASTKETIHQIDRAEKFIVRGLLSGRGYFSFIMNSSLTSPFQTYRLGLSSQGRPAMLVGTLFTRSPRPAWRGQVCIRRTAPVHLAVGIGYWLVGLQLPQGIHCHFNRHLSDLSSFFLVPCFSFPSPSSILPPSRTALSCPSVEDQRQPPQPCTDLRHLTRIQYDWVDPHERRPGTDYAKAVSLLQSEIPVYYVAVTFFCSRLWHFVGIKIYL